VASEAGRLEYKYVYRGTQSGGPYRKINAVLDPETAYTDYAVFRGQTYYYVTTERLLQRDGSGNS